MYMYVYYKLSSRAYPILASPAILYVIIHPTV